MFPSWVCAAPHPQLGVQKFLTIFYRNQYLMALLYVFRKLRVCCNSGVVYFTGFVFKNISITYELVIVEYK